MAVHDTNGGTYDLEHGRTHCDACRHPLPSVIAITIVPANGGVDFVRIVECGLCAALLQRRAGDWAWIATEKAKET